VTKPAPIVSVVTVVRDAPEAFVQTFSSIATQNVAWTRADHTGERLSHCEYIVIDGSQDRSCISTVLAECPQVPVTLRHSEPRGIYPAMNEALDLATGEYVYFLNAGDAFFGPDTLAAITRILGDTAPLWAYGEVEIVQTNGHRTITPTWDFSFERKRLFARGHFPPHQGTFVSRQVLRDLGGFDTTYRIVADYAMVLKLSAVADPLYLDMVIATFPEGGESTQNWSKSLGEFHRARREILGPQGWDAARERVDTARQWMAMAAYRNVWSRVRGS
jgi:glycosyltransferase involved in cell wall biosynthesis